jgi:hypothetical protein
MTNGNAEGDGEVPWFVPSSPDWPIVTRRVAEDSSATSTGSARPPSFSEEVALAALDTTAGCWNCRTERPQGRALDVESVRQVLAACQVEGGDPAEVYRRFLSVHPPESGSVPSLEDALPRPEDLAAASSAPPADTAES